MKQKTRYFITKAIRLALLCAGAAVIVLAGKSVITANRPVTDPDQKPAEVVNDPTDRVNINTATLQQLMDLPTIGQVIGSRIIEYRQQHGPFRHTSDIIIIKGISERKFRQLEDLITVGQVTNRNQ